MLNSEKQISVKIILFALLLMLSLNAQDKSQELIVLYNARQYDRIRAKLNTFSDRDTSRISFLFFKSIFLKNGEQAKKNYEKVFKNSSGRLKELAAQKLHDYYYALGFYQHASQYEKYYTNTGIALPITDQEGKEPKPDNKFFNVRSAFVIQFGAFSLKENALQRQRLLSAQNIRSKIVKRMINRREFYCVWVNGLSSIEETRKIADQIKSELKIDYRIIKQ